MFRTLFVCALICLSQIALAQTGPGLETTGTTVDDLLKKYGFISGSPFYVAIIPAGGGNTVDKDNLTLGQRSCLAKQLSALKNKNIMSMLSETHTLGVSIQLSDDTGVTYDTDSSPPVAAVSLSRFAEAEYNVAGEWINSDATNRTFDDSAQALNPGFSFDLKSAPVSWNWKIFSGNILLGSVYSDGYEYFVSYADAEIKGMKQIYRTPVGSTDISALAQGEQAKFQLPIGASYSEIIKGSYRTHFFGMTGRWFRYRHYRQLNIAAVIDTDANCNLSNPREKVDKYLSDFLAKEKQYLTEPAAPADQQ